MTAVEAPAPGGPAAQETTTPAVVEPVPFAAAGAVLALVSGLALAMHEVSALCSGFIADNGRFASPGMFAGPLAVGEVGRWNDPLTASSDALGDWTAMFVIYQVGQLVLVLVYGAVALLAWRRAGSAATEVSRRLRVVARLLVALAAASLVEAVLLTGMAVGRCPAGGCVPVPLAEVGALLTCAKWLIGAGVLLAVLRLAWAASTAASRRELRSAVWLQRFSLMAFLPVAVLGVLPLGTLVYDVFDQVPDVQRAWLDDGTAVDDLVAAGAVFLLLVLPAVFVTGRIRSQFAVARSTIGPWWPYFDQDPAVDPAWSNGRRQQLWFWLLGPALLLLVGLGVDRLTEGVFHSGRLVGFTLVAVVVIGASYALRYGAADCVSPRSLPARTSAFARYALTTGDVLAVAALSLTALGLVRAFTGPAVLSAFGYRDVDSATQTWQVALAMGGLVAAVGCWPVAQVVLRSWLPLRSEPASHQRGALIVAAGVVSTALFLFLCWQPQAVGDAVGALGAITLALGALTAMLGVVVAYAQRRQPPELLQLRLPSAVRSIMAAVRAVARRLPLVGSHIGTTQRDWRVKATPVVGLLLVAALVAQPFGEPTDVHPVTGGGPIPERETLAEAFTQWLAADGACSVPYPGDDEITMRPMVMFAAEGGGIRAAYWTAAALDRVAKAGSGCARRSGLFSAGASGGAVGLTLARFSDEPLRTVTGLTGPEALSQAAISLLSSDLLTSVAGIRFAADTDPRGAGSQQLLDRAGLMEVAWEAEATDLRQPYLSGEPPSGGSGAVTGHLILTTSVARNGCRALLSQVDLGGDTSLAAEPTAYDGLYPSCGRSPGVAGPNGFDLFHAYGLREGDDVDGGGRHCLGNIAALTGALLASRFPYVTPSGVVGPCEGDDPARTLHPLQIIDGGYTDNTGLGTIVDTARVWGPLVREHNRGVLDAGAGELVVPAVVYLENGTGKDFTVVGEDALDSDAVDEQQGEVFDKGGEWSLPLWPDTWAVPEALVPIVGARAGRNHKVRTQAWLQEAWRAVYRSLCDPEEVDDPATCETLRKEPTLKPRVYVVNQRPQPSTPAPLGWVLSAPSQEEMTGDLDHQESTPAVGTGRQYGTLHDLLDLVGAG